MSSSAEAISIVENLEFIEDRELGADAVFTISSAKAGNGVEQLRDNNTDTYWQSDGTFPHLINIQFLRKVCITKLCVFLDYSVDESYTAKKISLAIGSSTHDLMDLFVTELNEPVGWIVIDVTKLPIPNADSDVSGVRGHLLQFKVLSMHQNGKDTHVRQIKVFGRREAQRVMANLYPKDFKTVQMSQYSVIR
jgi:anaphase-promoting complex subunit 10